LLSAKPEEWLLFCSAPPPILEELGLDDILENDCFCCDGNGEQCTCAAFDMDWVSSSGNSCEDESCGRATVVRSFETIPESRKIESEICVVETVGSNSRKVNTKQPLMMHKTAMLIITNSAFLYKLQGNKEEEEAISGIPEGYVRWVMDEDGHFW
jgi:hypothetical protein